MSIFLTASASSVSEAVSGARNEAGTGGTDGCEPPGRRAWGLLQSVFEADSGLSGLIRAIRRLCKRRRQSREKYLEDSIRFARILLAKARVLAPERLYLRLEKPQDFFIPLCIHILKRQDRGDDSAFFNNRYVSESSTRVIERGGSYGTRRKGTLNPAL